jgi:hypothetical protein
MRRLSLATMPVDFQKKEAGKSLFFPASFADDFEIHFPQPSCPRLTAGKFFIFSSHFLQVLSLQLLGGPTISS